MICFEADRPEKTPDDKYSCSLLKHILIINAEYQDVRFCRTQTVSPLGEWSDFSLFYLESRPSAALLFCAMRNGSALPLKLPCIQHFPHVLTNVKNCHISRRSGIFTTSCGY
jgi:hypothetical protein